MVKKNNLKYWNKKLEADKRKEKKMWADIKKQQIAHEKKIEQIFKSYGVKKKRNIKRK